MNSPMAIDVARSVVANVESGERSLRENNARHKIYYIYRTIFQRAPTADETEKGLQFVNREMNEEPNIMAATKMMTARAEKKAEERERRLQTQRDNGTAAIQNKGSIVERKPLTAWETYAHALLLSNESAYVN